MLNTGALAALAAGGAAAVLQFAGALKAAAPLAALRPDLTLLALALLLAALTLLLAAREPVLARGLAWPLAGCGALWLWWVLAAAWSPWPGEALSRLRDMVVLGPVMLAAGLLVGADGQARRAFLAATLAIGPFVGLVVAHGLLTDGIVLGGEVGRDPTRVRVAYQIAGLAIACAAGLAALRLTAARGAARLGWAVLVAGLGAAVLLPGGRAAFFALLLVVALAPALRFALEGRVERGFVWVAVVTLAGFAGLAVLLLDPARAEQLATLERLLRATGDTASAREILWSEAWRQGGLLGLGPGGFPAAAGLGNDRGMHPHNHAIEALTEGGLVGLLLWLAAFLGATAVALRHALRVAPERAAAVFAVGLPVALSAMVSTDLGNRMMWFALGFALSLAAETRPRGAAVHV